jgi:hypothetical protein
LSHINGTVLDNGTYSGGNISHVGQVFWDETLRSAVELEYPYNTNSQPVTLNADDQLAAAEAENNYDPFASYVVLGDSLSDGLLAWITVGMDTSVDYSDIVDIAATLTSNGGVQNNVSSQNAPGGGGGNSSNSTGAPA